MIQEYKFLSSDIERTYLVKGLCYVLLQKVRCEINNKEREKEELKSLLFKHKDKEEGKILKKNRIGKKHLSTSFQKLLSRGKRTFSSEDNGVDLED
ncbi:hypothetical protein NPIL_379121 [Nephila pilipes]|uniref:RED-like N-terminal domain-containing protein n=1 Tax=Nephila pilipes TaxID=299642 RepID=A0A8X6T7I7_NEPPI|nr:hypothetical protein NPIL_379121 [Nephila pilipes]